MSTKIIGNLEWMLDPRSGNWDAVMRGARVLPLGEGWRVPSVQELVSLWSYRYNQCFEFPDPNARRWFWACDDASPEQAWAVGFADGSVFPQRKDDVNLVRFVRTVEASE